MLSFTACLPFFARKSNRISPISTVSPPPINNVGISLHASWNSESLILTTNRFQNIVELTPPATYIEPRQAVISDLSSEDMIPPPPASCPPPIFIASLSLEACRSLPTVMTTLNDEHHFLSVKEFVNDYNDRVTDLILTELNAHTNPEQIKQTLQQLTSDCLNQMPIESPVTWLYIHCIFKALKTVGQVSDSVRRDLHHGILRDTKRRVLNALNVATPGFITANVEQILNNQQELLSFLNVGINRLNNRNTQGIWPASPDKKNQLKDNIPVYSFFESLFEIKANTLTFYNFEYNIDSSHR